MTIFFKVFFRPGKMKHFKIEDLSRFSMTVGTLQEATYSYFTLYIL